MFSNLALAFYLAFFSLSFTSPAVAHRQVASSVLAAALTSPTSVTTTSTIQTANGPMNETCVLTFTPVGDQIQEVQNCTMVMGGSQVSSTIITPSSTMNSSSPADSVASATAVVQAAFVIPGRSMLVLPVGISVFGGITGITIFIVVLVTLERVRYRKVFRQRRLAEQGAMIGSGGSFLDKV
ncbi:hypothetical protein K503DRAFT_847902 [Rhizopogon vinicolor AM-OR11-026]|uniref:Mid2 domain-containing protein n=1 Tax=Rhizopogon vinicolor AM-OR11-026 TaxID=1314800 RepID=A0A1B7NBS3_9AGAM|nr:hypothetical protein K503DRAFT_847902 [Rhizopogon vinicolor AM-OR11-026]